MQKAWLASVSWDLVTALNAQLCETKQALHKPTSDGHDVTRDLWNESHRREMSWDEAVELCRKCHKIAPFCFFNGNTFAAIIKIVVKQASNLDARDQYALQSISAHIVAGTATPEEEAQFKSLLGKIGG